MLLNLCCSLYMFVFVMHRERKKNKERKRRIIWNKNIKKMSWAISVSHWRRGIEGWFSLICITKDLSWSVNAPSTAKMAWQYLCSLRLHKNHLEQQLVLSCNQTPIQWEMALHITVWWTSCSVADRKRLQRVRRTAEKITDWELPFLQDMSTPWSL